MPLVESGAAPRTPELAEQTCFSPPENESEPRRWVPVFHSLASWNRPAAISARDRGVRSVLIRTPGTFCIRDGTEASSRSNAAAGWGAGS